MKIFNITSLRRHDGDSKQEIYIAYKGFVYDVSDCPKWKTGLHENLHFGGQDLSSELINAPHTKIVFDYPSVKLVGKLERDN